MCVCVHIFLLCLWDVQAMASLSLSLTYATIRHVILRAHFQPCSPNRGVSIAWYKKQISRRLLQNIPYRYTSYCRSVQHLGRLLYLWKLLMQTRTWENQWSWLCKESLHVAESLLFRSSAMVKVISLFLGLASFDIEWLNKS